MESPITTALINSGAGTLGGIVSYSIFYPLENFRTRLQVREKTTPNHTTTTTTTTTSTSLDAHQTILSYIITKMKEIWKEIRDTIAYANQIYQTQGLSGFYQGLGAGVFGIGVSNAIYMYWYQLLKDLMLKFRKLQNIYQHKNQSLQSKQRQITLSPLDNIIVASLAGVVNITITNPIWVVNTRMMLRDKVEQIHDNITDTIQQLPSTLSTAVESTTTTTTTTESKSTSITQMVMNIPSYLSQLWFKLINYLKSTEVFQMVKEEGFSSLFKGYAASLVLVLNPTIQYVLYDQLVLYIKESRQKQLISNAHGKKVHDHTKDSLTNLEYFLLSAFCKALSTICTFPYQVVKAQQQAYKKQPKTILSTTQAVQLVKQLAEASINNNTTTTTTNSINTDSNSELDVIDELKKVQNRDEALSLYDTMVKMYERDGIEVFFRGLVPKLIQTVSNTALSTVLHERIKEQLTQMLLPNIDE